MFSISNNDIYISVKRRVYELIGCLTKNYPNCIENYEEGTQIRDTFFRTLEDVVINQNTVSIHKETEIF